MPRKVTVLSARWPPLWGPFGVSGEENTHGGHHCHGPLCLLCPSGGLFGDFSDGRVMSQSIVFHPGPSTCVFPKRQVLKSYSWPDIELRWFFFPLRFHLAISAEWKIYIHQSRVLVLQKSEHKWKEFLLGFHESDCLESLSPPLPLSLPAPLLLFLLCGICHHLSKVTIPYSLWPSRPAIDRFTKDCPFFLMLWEALCDSSLEGTLLSQTAWVWVRLGFLACKIGTLVVPTLLSLSNWWNDSALRDQLRSIWHIVNAQKIVALNSSVTIT